MRLRGATTQLAGYFLVCCPGVGRTSDAHRLLRPHSPASPRRSPPMSLAHLHPVAGQRWASPLPLEIGWKASTDTIAPPAPAGSNWKSTGGKGAAWREPLPPAGDVALPRNGCYGGGSPRDSQTRRRVSQLPRDQSGGRPVLRSPDEPGPEGLEGSLRLPAVNGQVSSLLLRRAKQFNPQKALRPPE
jgi:hypothetical protein